MTPHKHLDLIVAWAIGHEVQWRRDWGQSPTSWKNIDEPGFPGWHFSTIIFRIKPEPKPDRSNEYHVQWLPGVNEPKWHQKALCNLKLTFDGETGVLKKAEVINEA